MWRLDLAFADVVASSSDVRLGAIRLAWWREQLEALDGGRVPAEPRLSAVAADLLPRGTTGRALSHLEDCWLPMLEPFPWAEAQAEAFAERGALLFGSGAQLMGHGQEPVLAAGALWSLVDGAVHCTDERSRAMLTQCARARIASLPPKVPGALRPLTVLAALTVADMLGKSRGVAAVRHRLTGRFPR